MFDRLRLLFAKGTQGVCVGFEEIGVGFQQWSVAGSQARKEDHDCSVASGHAILGPGETAIHQFVSVGSISVPRMMVLAVDSGLMRLLWLRCLRAVSVDCNLAV